MAADVVHRSPPRVGAPGGGRFACPGCGARDAGVAVEAVIPLNLRADGHVDTRTPVNALDLSAAVLLADGAALCRRCGHCAPRADFEPDVDLVVDNRQPRPA